MSSTAAYGATLRKPAQARNTRAVNALSIIARGAEFRLEDSSRSGDRTVVALAVTGWLSIGHS